MLQLLRALWSFAMGLAVGLAVGYVAGQLLAPSEGVTTRRRLHDDAAQWRDTPRLARDAAQERLGLAVAEGRRVADQVRLELETQTGVRKAVPPPARGEAPV